MGNNPELETPAFTRGRLHMKSIMGKLDAGNRNEAVVQARRLGLIP